MLVLIELALSGWISLLTGTPEASPVRLALAGLLGLMTMALAVAALVLAIVGLVEYSSHAALYRQGRAQAVWALVLGGLVCVGCLAGIVGGLVRAGQRAGKSQASQPRPGEVVTFEPMNFRFQVPNRPWVSIEASKVNRESQLAFVRSYPEATCLLIADVIGVDTELTTHGLVEDSLARMKARTRSVRELSMTPWTIHGLRGELRELEAQVGLQSLYYLQWYSVTNGYAYQLIGFGQVSDRSRLVVELKQVFAGFQPLDPHRVALTGGGSFTTNYVSPRGLYTIRLTNSPWHPMPGMEKDFPHAEFGGSQRDSWFVVTPAWLGGERLDPEAATSALLSLLGVSYPNGSLTRRQSITNGGLSGVQYDFAREVDGIPFRYRFKLLEGENWAALVAAWTQRRGTNAEAVMADALARVKIAPSPLPAPGTEAMTRHELKARGFVLNQAGLFYFNAANFEKALPLFRAATRANGQEPLYLGNALQTWRQLERPKEALEFLTQQEPTAFERPEVKAWLAYYQAESSLTDQAVTNYASVFANGFRNELHFTEYIRLLCRERQPEQALAEIRSYVQGEDSIAARLLEAEIYRGQRDFSKAIALLQAQREKAPFNTQIATTLIETMLQAGQNSEALEASRALAKSQGDSAYAAFLRGRSELGLKWYREAKASFEAAKKLAPASTEIGSYLDHVSGLLGEGNNSLLKEPISAVAVPAVLTNSPAEPVPGGYARKYGAYYARVLDAVSYEPAKEYKRTQTIWVQVLDASGVAAFSTVEFPFDPLGEEVYVNEVRVLDEHGKTLSTGQVADYYVLDEPNRGQASQKKILHIPVSGLQAGCQLVVSITRREAGRLEQFPFLEHSFARSLPVRESLLFLRGEAAGLDCRTSQPLEARKLPEGQCWSMREPPVARWEPLQPPPATFLPMLWISDGTARWPALASNYLASIQSCQRLTEPLREQARQLTVRAAGAEEKIAVLARHVQTNYTYKAIEFGRRARVPNAPEVVVRNKYGDCKDHALLLQQWLVAAGVPAKLALVNTRNPVRLEQPSLDQFDHMIVHVPGKGTGLFLDCTDKGSDLMRVQPMGLVEHEAWILDEQNPRFATVPPYSLNASSIEVHRRVRVGTNGESTVDETLNLSGVHAGYFRGFLLAITPAMRRTVVQRQFEMADLDLSELRIEGLEQPEQPIRLHCAYGLKGQFRHAPDGWRGLLRAPIERTYLAAEPLEERLTPFELTIPLWLRSTVTVELPPGFSPGPVEEPDPKLDSRFGTVRGHLRLEPGRLESSLECRRLTGRFKAGDYAAYRQAMMATVGLLEREVVLKAQARGPAR